MIPLEAVFQALNDRGARYVLVGGLAVVMHGHLRATGDVDLIVDLGPGEVEKTLASDSVRRALGAISGCDPAWRARSGRLDR